MRKLAVVAVIWKNLFDFNMRLYNGFSDATTVK